MQIKNMNSYLYFVQIKIITVLISFTVMRWITQLQYHMLTVKLKYIMVL